MKVLRFLGLVLVLALLAVPGRALVIAGRLYQIADEEYYVCDCAAGADSDCVAGNDANSGSSPDQPWRTYEQARSQFGSLLAGDAIRFCQGGAFTLDQSGDNWVNGQCTAANPCTVGDYDPPWGSGDENRPILRRTIDGHAFALDDGGNADHEEGYIFENLDLRCSSCNNANGFFVYNDIDDVLIDNVRMDGFGIGVHLATSNPCSSDPECNGRNERITVREATIVNGVHQGLLGGSDGLVLEDSYFENNGGGTMFDHNIYISSGDNMRISGNELYRSSLDGEGRCAGVSLVGHGEMTNLLIEDNYVHEDVGFATEGCWGIAIDPGYASAERFENVIIRGNRVVNVGNMAIGVGACVNCLIENNVVIHHQSFGVGAIAVPDRTPGSGDAETTNVTVRNNSILIGSEGLGIRLNREGTGHQIVSNAIRYTGSNTLWWCLQADLATSSYDAIDYNVCDSGPGDWALDTGSLDLAAWQALGWGVHSQATDPGFSGDYDLTPATGGAALVGAGHPTLSSPTDLNDVARDGAPDAGAYEFVPQLRLEGTPGDQAIYLDWEVDITLPTTTTWGIDYVSDTLPSLVLTAIDSLSATRAYTLTGLTNYEWYTVTLHAMVDSTSFLSDTVRVMVTDIFVYLPLVAREE